MDKRLAKELIKSRKAVKEKYRILKLASSAAQSELEQTYKPITAPLQQLVASLGEIKEEPVEVKEEPFTTQSEIQTSTPTKQKFKKTGTTPVLPTEMPSFLERSVRTLPSFSQTSVLAETTPPLGSSSERTLNLSDILEQSRLAISHYVGTPAYQDWLEAFDPLPRAFVDDQVKDTEGKFDHQYGIVHDYERDKFFLGLTQKPVEIVGKDIKVAGLIYPGTVGLYELLFKKRPVGYKQEDLENYMDILKRTNAYRRNHDPEEQVQGNTSYKYIHIIAPYLQKKGIIKKSRVNPGFERLAEAFSKPASQYRLTRQTSKKEAGMTLKVNKENTDYIYWDNANELVDRLRLLIGSVAAGHTGHTNEIISIIEELREAKIII